MRIGLLILFTILCVTPATATQRPLSLAILPDDESIYAPAELPKPGDGINAGGVNVDFTVRYMTDYVYRGIDHSEVGGHEDSPNLQFDTQLTFDFGKAPHVFIGTFVNIYDADPISRFQEIRPTFGLEWTLRPLVLTGGYISYILPEREEMNTGEIFGRIEIDDSYFLRTDKPVFSPYVYGAYDHDLNNGWYLQAGVKHEQVIEDTNITLTFFVDVAYVIANQQFAVPGKRDSGFQHYDLGMIGSYSMNSLLNIPKRYGTFSLQGYLNYVDGLTDSLRADTQLWGGVGIAFHY